MSVTRKATIGGHPARMSIRQSDRGAIQLDFGSLEEPSSRYCTVRVQLARASSLVDLDLDDAKVAAAALVGPGGKVHKAPWGWSPQAPRTWRAEVLVWDYGPQVVVRTAFAWHDDLYSYPRNWFATWTSPDVPTAIAHNLIWRHREHAHRRMA